MGKIKIAVLSALQFEVLTKIKDGEGIIKTDTDRFVTKVDGTHINKRTVSKLMETSFLSYISETECKISFYGERYLATHEIVANSSNRKKVVLLDGEQLHVPIVSEKKVDMALIGEMIEKVIENITDVVEDRIMAKFPTINDEHHGIESIAIGNSIGYNEMLDSTKGQGLFDYLKDPSKPNQEEEKEEQKSEESDTDRIRMTIDEKEKEEEEEK